MLEPALREKVSFAASAVLAVLSCALFASPASAASAQTTTSSASAAPRSIQIHLVNSAGLPGTEVRAFERAAVAQGKQLRRAWGTPVVRFAARGWRMTVFPQHDARLQGTGGFHAYAKQPYALVADRAYWTVIAFFLHRLKHARSIVFGHATTVDPSIGRQQTKLGWWMRHGREAPFE
jgi:hypothetical protein